jgi:hypothetical protein
VLLSDALKCRAPDQRGEQRLRSDGPITEREEEGNRAPARYDRIHDLKDSRGLPVPSGAVIMNSLKASTAAAIPET